ncbi:MAG TPA: PQQ-binding-like beta-propeller repeat protein [Anaerohalosphaeraceae bacterium]|nr:PQQ-binding-like beta-propeller repeat protein [Anaerohalosphaeraceae bacterium]
MHLQRTVVPFLLLLLPLTAVLAVIAAHRQAKLQKKEPLSPPAVRVSFGTDSWPMFRGNPQLTGTASGELPEHLTLAWKFKTNGPVKSTPIAADGKVYITSTDQKLYAVDLKTGSLLWSRELGEMEASALWTKSALYVGTTTGWFYALNPADGAVLWKYETKGKIAGSANFLNGCIFFGSYDGTLHALSPDGKVLWTFQTESYLNGTPAAVPSAVIAGGCDANLYLIHPDDPRQVRRIDTGSYIPSSPAVYENLAYIGNFEGQLFCVDTQTAQIVWTSSHSDDAFFAAPAVNEQYLVVGSQKNKVLCLDRKTGGLLWTFRTEDAVNSSPVICGTKVLFGSDDGFFRMLSLTDGKELWSANLARPIASSPAVVSNLVLIGCDDGFVYAWKQPD